MTDYGNIKGKISIRAYARLLGVDEKTVRKAKDAGLLGDGWDPDSGKIIADKATKNWGFQYQTQTTRPGVGKLKVVSLFSPAEIPNMDGFREEEEEGGAEWLKQEEIRTGGLLEGIQVHSKLSAQEAVRQREIVALAMDKKKLQEMEGTLVRRDAVENALYLAGSELKKSLLDIPARVVRDIMAAVNEVEGINILSTELVQVLETYGKLKDNSLGA
jgi:hypothetical protein